MDLKTTLLDIRNGLRGGAFTSEASVSQGIVLKVLSSLGWAVFDTRVVSPEFSVGNRRVDFALCNPPGKPIIFVEVKKVGALDGAERQLFEYAFHLGVPMLTLTDGQQWRVFLPSGHGTYNDRRVYRVDLLERDIDDAVSRLTRYLEFARVASGEALRAAQRDYSNVARDREIQRTLPKAWRELLQEQDSLLLELLAEKVEDICGFKPDLDTCSVFMSALDSSRSDQREHFHQPTIPTTIFAPEAAPRSTKPGSHDDRGSLKKFVYRIRGEQRASSFARDVMLDIFGYLHDTDEGIFRRFMALKHGRK